MGSGREGWAQAGKGWAQAEKGWAQDAKGWAQDVMTGDPRAPHSKMCICLDKVLTVTWPSPYGSQ